MKKKQIHCPYCGAKASLRPASAVYGLSLIHISEPTRRS